MKYRNKKTGTEYVKVQFITGVKLAKVVTKAGAKYIVNADSIVADGVKRDD